LIHFEEVFPTQSLYRIDCSCKYERLQNSVGCALDGILAKSCINPDKSCKTCIGCIRSRDLSCSHDTPRDMKLNPTESNLHRVDKIDTKNRTQRRSEKYRKIGVDSGHQIVFVLCKKVRSTAESVSSNQVDETTNK